MGNFDAGEFLLHAHAGIGKVGSSKDLVENCVSGLGLELFLGFIIATKALYI